MLSTYTFTHTATLNSLWFIHFFLIAQFSHTVAEFIAQSQSQYSFFLWEEGTPSACSLAQQESVLLNCLFSVYNPIAMDLIGFEMLHECLVSFNYSVLFVQNPTSSSTETTTWVLRITAFKLAAEISQYQRSYSWIAWVLLHVYNPTQGRQVQPGFEGVIPGKILVALCVVYGSLSVTL